MLYWYDFIRTLECTRLFSSKNIPINWLTKFLECHHYYSSCSISSWGVLDYCYCLTNQAKSMFLQLFRSFGGLPKILWIPSYLWVYHREILEKGGGKALNHYSPAREESSIRYTNFACSLNKIKITLSFKMEKSWKTLYSTPKVTM